MERFHGLSWMVGGEAGWGINVAAEILSKALLRHGYYVFSNVEYESLIRGGHSYYRVRFSNRPVRSHVDYVDVLLALDDKTIVGDGIHTRGHRDELLRGSVLIYDSGISRLDAEVLEELKARGVAVAGLPMAEIVRSVGVGGERAMVMRNMAGLGASAYVFGLDPEVVEGAIGERFEGRGREVAEANVRVFRLGYEYFEENYGGLRRRIEPAGVERAGIANGNYMAVVGSVRAGVKFWAQYPMTPATPMLSYIKEVSERYGIVVVQPESEVAAINMAIGAGYAGARAAVGTSGGGFALMTEAISFASMAEIPVVIFHVSRVGPSTGMPTRTEQGDLFQVLYAGQGRSVKAVILPGDPLEVYLDAQIAFNVAEKYQVPVIVHYDKHLAESYYTFEVPRGDEVSVDRGVSAVRVEGSNGLFKRYEITESGVSPRPVLGLPGVVYLTSSLEHNEYGLFTEDGEVRKAMEDKRARKLESLAREIEEHPQIYRPVNTYWDGDIAVICWGSTKGVLLDAIEHLNGRLGGLFRLVQVRWAEPFPKSSFAEAVEGANYRVFFENNSTGQLEMLVRQQLCMAADRSIRKYDGRPFSLNEAVDRLMEVVRVWRR
ncbi:2-oxoacid:ferredoxin oxidoreductase subunit alpha [Candidatus Geothermarchaeota archaeon ex4572_27]|nr:MAG: 2-oxoacid:ferredoxin oxidoreductase subunit alpha [Candidatus Geothermarchaeota archaeon ex4572_27]